MVGWVSMWGGMCRRKGKIPLQCCDRSFEELMCPGWGEVGGECNLAEVVA